MTALEAQQKFERYSIIRLLGSGISGESYEAEDTLRQRKVTLKVLHPWGRLPEPARRQFFREMQRISTLQHAYLAATLDYGEHDGYLYVVRRYVSPGSLLSSEGRYWFRPPLEIADALHVAHQLAQTLQHVHSNGYSHGSLTLSNILVLRGPNLDHDQDFAPFLLADIGLVSFIRRFGQPQTTILPVTAAPEQLGGRTTAASDQYALAVILYFWLVGRLPFMGTVEEVEQLKLTETLPSLTMLNEKVTAQQERVLRRALSVYPDERYPSILAFTQALVSAANVNHTEPEPVTPSYPDPLPQTQPDVPLPIPTPEPEIVPLPEKTPEPTEPSIEPVPAPEVTPPAPDIPQQVPASVPSPIQPTEPKDMDETAETRLALQEASAILEIQDVTTDAVAEAETNTACIMPCFLVTSPYSETSSTYLLDQQETTLGRAGSSTILLDQDENISRHHAIVTREGEYLVIYDQQSVSGVYINGQRLADEMGHMLVAGDSVSIGAYTLLFHWTTAKTLPTQLTSQLETAIRIR